MKKGRRFSELSRDEQIRVKALMLGAGVRPVVKPGEKTWRIEVEEVADRKEQSK